MAELELYILVCKVCVVDAQCFVVRSFKVFFKDIGLGI